MVNNMSLWHEIKREDLPALPGIYAFIDMNGVKYIGKAINLKKRISDRFPDMIVKVRITKSEKEALDLESKFIERLKPEYNIKNVKEKKIKATFYFSPKRLLKIKIASAYTESNYSTLVENAIDEYWDNHKEEFLGDISL